MSSEAELVAKGALLMDRILPGWHRRVDLDKLDMLDGSMCLLGQTFGVHAEKCLAREMYPEEWEEAVDKAFWQAKTLGPSNVDALTHIGYNIAIDLRHTGSMLPAVLAKTNLTTEMSSEYAALRHVCNGHDTRCEWSNEIAARLAADNEGEVEEDVKSSEG